MGVAATSYHNATETRVEYSTKGCDNGPWLPQGQPVVCTPPEFQEILMIANPLGEALCYENMNCCGTPAADSPYVHGGNVLPALEQRFPHLGFQVYGEFVGFGKHAHWRHYLFIQKQLPNGWEMAFDETNQRHYYFNRQTEERVWELPAR